MANPSQAASVLLNLVSSPPRPPKEPPVDMQVLPPPPPGCGLSVGSATHELRRCKPCAFFWKSDGCQSGQACLFCHLCPPDEKKRRKKERRFVASMGVDRTARRTRVPSRPQEYAPQDTEEAPWQESVPGIVAPELRDVEAQIIQKALLEQEVAEAEAEWGWRPYPSWNQRAVLQLDKDYDYGYDYGYGLDGQDYEGECAESTLPTLLPLASSPQGDDDKENTVDSFFSGDPFSSLRNAGV